MPPEHSAQLRCLGFLVHLHDLVQRCSLRGCEACLLNQLDNLFRVCLVHKILEDVRE